MARVSHPGLAALKAFGLLGELNDSVLAQLADELCGADQLDEDFPVIDILDAYYLDEERGAARSQKDGYIRHDWRFGQETSDVVAEFAALLGGNPLFRQLSYRDEGNQSRLAVRRDDGAGLSLIVQSLDDVAALFDYTLKERGDARRFFALETEGDWHAYLLLKIDRAKVLMNDQVLPMVDFDGNVAPNIPTLTTSDTWPGEILPANMEKYSVPEGMSDICGRFALVYSYIGTPFYATADLHDEKPHFVRHDGEYVIHVDQAQDGAWLVCYGVAGVLQHGYIFRPSICYGDSAEWIDFELPAEAADDTIQPAYFFNDSSRIIAFPEKIDRPLISDGKKLKVISALPPRLECEPASLPSGGSFASIVAQLNKAAAQPSFYAAFGLVRRNQATDVLIWNGDGYELVDGTWKMNFPLRIEKTGAGGGLSSAPAGRDGFFYISDFQLYEVHPGGGKPRQHLGRDFCFVTPGPDGALLLRWGTNDRGDIAALYFPEDGRFINLTGKTFGSPAGDISHLYYSDTTRIIYALCEDDLLALRVDTILARS